MLLFPRAFNIYRRLARNWQQPPATFDTFPIETQTGNIAIRWIMVLCLTMLPALPSLRHKQFRPIMMRQ